MSQRELGMCSKHRKHIERNIEKLVKCTNYTHLVMECINVGTITSEMRRDIEELKDFSCCQSEDERRLEQHRQLFRKITKRGPVAYRELIAALKTLGCAAAIRILESVDEDDRGLEFISIAGRKNARIPPDETASTTTSTSAPIDVAYLSNKQYNDVSSPLEPYTDAILRQTRVVHKSDKIHTDKTVGVYSMKSRHNRGVLFMVNIIEFPTPNRLRKGAERDGDSLIHIFREMGFLVFAFNNLTQEEFFKLLKDLIASDYVRDTECFVMALMTHGQRINEKDKVEFRDGSVVDVRQIINHFQNDKCPALVGKPKVMIFPFCRGDEPDKGVQRIQTDGGIFIPNNISTLSDILVCYGSTAGFETHRDPDTGSWYIQTLCDMLAEHAHDMPYEDILKKIQARVGIIRTKKGNLQTGAYENIGFNLKLYLNPGFWEE